MILHFLFLTISLFLFYFVGSLVYTFFTNANNNEEEKIIIFTKSLIVGFISIIGIYSIYITNFVTINLLFLVIASIYIKHIWHHKSKLRFPKFDGKSLGYGVVVSLLFLFIQYIFNEYFSNTSLIYGYSDYYFYTHNAASINKYGIEGLNFYSLSANLDATEHRFVYHYFDLWVNAFYQRFGILNKIEIYQYVFMPLVFTLCFFCFLSLTNVLKVKNNIVCGLIAFSAIFFIGLIPIKNVSFSSSVFNLPKIFPAYLFTCIFVIELFNEKYISAVTWLSLMCVFNVIACPIVLSIIFLLGLHLSFKKEKATGFYCILLSLVIPLFYILYYSILGNLLGHVVATTNFNITKIVKKFLYIFFRENIFRLPFFYLILFLTFIFFITTKDKKAQTIKYIHIVLLSLLLLLPIFFSSLLNFNVDSFQLSLFPFPAAIIILILTMASYLSERKKLIIHILFVAQSFYVLGLLILKKDSEIYPRVSKVFIKSLNHKISSKAIGCFIYDKAENYDYNKSNWSLNQFSVLGPHFIGVLNKDIELINITISDINKPNILNSNINIEVLKKGEFISYFGPKDSSLSHFEKQNKYVRENNISFIIVENKNLQNDYLKNICRDSIEDSISKYTVYFL